MVRTVPGVMFIVTIILICLLTVLGNCSRAGFRSITVSVFTDIVIPFNFSVFVELHSVFVGRRFNVCLVFCTLVYTLKASDNTRLKKVTFNGAGVDPGVDPGGAIRNTTYNLIFSLVLGTVTFIVCGGITSTSLSTMNTAVLLTYYVPISFVNVVNSLDTSILGHGFNIGSFNGVFPNRNNIVSEFSSILFAVPIACTVTLVTFYWL